MQHNWILLCWRSRPRNLQEGDHLHLWIQYTSLWHNLRGYVFRSCQSIPFPHGSWLLLHAQCARCCLLSLCSFSVGWRRSGWPWHLRSMGVCGRHAYTRRLWRPHGHHAGHGKHGRLWDRDHGHHRPCVKFSVPLSFEQHFSFHTGLLRYFRSVVLAMHWIICNLQKLRSILLQQRIDVLL